MKDKAIAVRAVKNGFLVEADDRAHDEGPNAGLHVFETAAGLAAFVAEWAGEAEAAREAARPKAGRQVDPRTYIQRLTAVTTRDDAAFGVFGQDHPVTP